MKEVMGVVLSVVFFTGCVGLASMIVVSLGLVVVDQHTREIIVMLMLGLPLSFMIAFACMLDS